MENYKEVTLTTSSTSPPSIPYFSHQVPPQKEDWQTGKKAAEDVLIEAALAEAAGVGAHEAGPAENSAQAGRG